MNILLICVTVFAFGSLCFIAGTNFSDKNHEDDKIITEQELIYLIIDYIKRFPIVRYGSDNPKTEYERGFISCSNEVIKLLRKKLSV